MSPDDLKNRQRSYTLELWWLKARRAATGQNNAAVKAANIDSRLTRANIFLPIIILAIGAAHSLSTYVASHMSVDFVDLMAIATASIVALSVFQLTGNYKVHALLHRQASCEFDAIAQRIEVIGFRADDDELFRQIVDQLQRVERSCRHVPDKHWAPAQNRYRADIEAFRTRIRFSSFVGPSGPVGIDAPTANDMRAA